MRPRWGSVDVEYVSYRAELAGKEEDASLKQHAGIELEQVPHIYCHNQLRQVPLGNTHTINERCIVSKTTPTLKDRYKPGDQFSTLTFSGMQGRLLGSGAMKYGT